MFYKKRIAELERTVTELIDVLEKSEVIRRSVLGAYTQTTINSNWRLAERIKRNKTRLEIQERRNRDLLEYLGVLYVTETTKLRKRKKK